MSRNRRSLSVAAALVAGLSVTAISTNAEAGPPYPIRSDFKFDSSSKYGLIVFLVEPQTEVKDFGLDVERFDLVTHKWAYNPLKGWSRFGKIGLNKTDRAYIISALDPPGTYAINNIHTQSYWRACFDGGTEAFEVKPGAVTFVGLLDPAVTLREISQGLPHVVTGHIAPAPVTLYGRSRPPLTAANGLPRGQDDLAAYLRQNFPGITAPIEPATLVETAFDASQSLGAKTCERY